MILYRPGFDEVNSEIENLIIKANKKYYMYKTSKKNKKIKLRNKKINIRI
jgi:hypothetical protein